MSSKLGIRHFHVFMMLMVITTGYILRVNLSVTIVAITNKTSANPNFPEYKWTESEKSKILSSFFWGYPMFQIIAGNIGEKFGTKYLLSGAMLLCSVLTILTPAVAACGSVAVCVLRMLIGAAQGVFYPCVTVLISKWVLKDEQGFSYTLAFSGTHLGTLTGLPLSGYLSSSEGGWPSVFYITGGMGILWVLAFSWFGASTPSLHRSISDEEKNMIALSLQDQHNDEKLPTPWREIATSLPLWAVFIAHLGQNWGFWTLLTEMPSYVNSVLGFDIKSNGLLSSLPYLAGWLAAILFSSIFTKMNHKNIFKKRVLRKIFNTIAFWGCSFSLVLLSTTKTANSTVAILLLISAVALDSAIYSGFITSHVDLSPNFCGTLMGITNSFSNISSILGPLCVGWIVTDSSSMEQWKLVFLLSAVVMFTTNAFYLIFGKAEVQPWNNPNHTEQEKLPKAILLKRKARDENSLLENFSKK